MRFTSIKNAFAAHPAASLGLGAFLLYLPWLGAADLLTDEAKSALNISYPHPPLMRGLMALSQSVFGTNGFAVRLPSVVFGAIGVAVMFLLLKRLFGSRKTAVYGAVIFGLLPTWVTYTRSGYLSVPLATCILLMLLGISRLSEHHEDAVGQRLIFIGLALGLWCELQGALLVPIWAWWQWRNRAALKRDPRARAYAIFGLAHIVGFGLYILGSPQTMADVFSFERYRPEAAYTLVKGVLGWIYTSSFEQWAVAALVLVGLNLWLRRSHLRQPEGQAIALTAGIFILYAGLFILPSSVVRPSDYCGPYLAITCLPLALLLLTRFSLRIQRIAIGVTIMTCAFLLPFSYVVTSQQTFFRRNAAEFALALKGERGAIVLGAVGYEAQYYMPVPLTKWPNDPNRRISRTVLVFRPESLNAQEQTILKGLSFDRLIGPVAVYRLR